MAPRRILSALFIMVGGLLLSDASVAAFSSTPESTRRPASEVSSNPAAWLSSGPTATVSADTPLRVAQLTAWGGDRANALAFSPDGQALAVGTSIGLSFYDAQTLTLMRFIKTETWVRSVAYSAKGDLLATGSYDRVIRLWRPSDGALLRSLGGHVSWVRSIAFSPDGEMLASASDDNTVRLWRVTDGGLLTTLVEGTEGARAVAFSPDGTLLATGGYDNAIRLWRVADGKVLRTLSGHTGWIRCLAFSPDGEMLASGAFDATARLWRVADGAPLSTLKGHDASVLGVAFSPDGKTLATGSVDATIRLWRVWDGALLRVLMGHEDFVFSVAFSPNGETLASGAVDNTVRLWDVGHIADAPPLTGEAIPAASKSQSCVACHHPHGNFREPGRLSEPARVLEVDCTTCHLGGPLVLNWCPAIPGLRPPVSVRVASPTASEKIGVPVGNREFEVVIATPLNGERFYSYPMITAMPVKGRINYTGELPMGLELSLEIWSGAERVSLLTAQPGSDGFFSFDTNLSPDGAQLEMPIEERGCDNCHGETLRDKPSLPPGNVRIVVTAQTPDGRVASDERWIVVDRGQSAMATVQVVREADGQPVADLPVLASTRLYEWRGRSFTSITNRQGYATFQVEALSEAPTNYVFEVEPIAVNGVWYEETAPVEVTLPEGATSVPDITLRARSQAGEIVGHIDAPNNATPTSLPIHAIHLPEGTCYDTTAGADGAFAFADLPIGRYLVAADTDALAVLGLSGTSQTLDLAQSPRAESSLTTAPLDGVALHGAIRDAEKKPLPFAWVTLDQTGRGTRVKPDSGSWTLWGLRPQARTVLVSAPGFYSQALAISAGSDLQSALEFNLTLRSDTQRFAWGRGHIFIPAETHAIVTGQQIALDKGWLWGFGSGSQPVVIQTAGATLSMHTGRFALEKLPGQIAWLYVFEGEAEVYAANDPELKISIPANHMMALQEHGELTPVPLDKAVVEALQAGSASPLSPVWEPTLGAQLRDRLALLGINAAQIVTLVTYLMVLVSLAGAPLIGILWWTKQHPQTWKWSR